MNSMRTLEYIHIFPHKIPILFTERIISIQTQYMQVVSYTATSALAL
jgi:hypothetical protein